MRSVLTWVLGIGLGANGLLMVAVPAIWYTTIPGVMETGPSTPISSGISAPPIVWAERR